MKTQSKIKIDDSLSVYVLNKGVFLVENELNKSYIVSEYALKKMYSYYLKYKLADSLVYDLQSKIDKKEKKEKIYQTSILVLSTSLITSIIMFIILK